MSLSCALLFVACLCTLAMLANARHAPAIRDQKKAFVVENVSRTKREASQNDGNISEDMKPKIYALTVTSSIRYRYARTVVSSRIANPSNISQEYTFSVTLPEAAFISEFIMVLKENTYKAYVKEKEEAKKEYSGAVNRGEATALVELNARDSNLFTVSVNVEPSSKATFNLTYEQMLKRTLGLYEDVINVNPGQIVKTLSVEVDILESSNITTLQVPDVKVSNEIDATEYTDNKIAAIERPSGKEAKILWRASVEQQKEMSASGAKGQLIIRYDVDRVAHPNQILIDEGYFVHFYAPADLKSLPKHVVFTLDVSGSMSGRKIEQLREALTQILGEIAETDFFSIVLFSDSVQIWTMNGTVGETSPALNFEDTKAPQTSQDVEVDETFIIPASLENIAKARLFASTLNETGGTNIIAALKKSLQISQWGQQNMTKGVEPIIIFLTDGQPNVEVSDTEEIVKIVKKLNVGRYALFSLAFGEYAEYNFLRKLSLTNSGFARNIYVASDTFLQLKNFYKQVASPLLSNVTFNYLDGQVENGTLTKYSFGNLFNGSELVVAGKLSERNGNYLNGSMNAKSLEGPIDEFFTPDMIACPELDSPKEKISRTFGHLEKLWAYLSIQDLLDQDATSNEVNSTYKMKALNLSLEYSFVTPFTSLVVVKPNASEVPSQLHSGNTGDLSHRYQPSALQFDVAPSLFSSIQDDALLVEKEVVDASASDTSPIISTNASTNGSDLPKLTIKDISWLNDSNSVQFPSSNNTYSVASSDLPDTEFHSCLLPNGQLSKCRHLSHCVIPEIVTSYEEFVKYTEECVIDARFVGICCPENHPHKATLGGTTSTPSLPTNSSSPDPNNSSELSTSSSADIAK